MAEEEKKEEEKKEGKEGEGSSPEEAAKERVELLDDEVKRLEQEIRSLEGGIKVRNAKEIKEIKAENETLKKRTSKLRQVLYALVIDVLKPREAADVKLSRDTLKQSGLNFVSANDIDKEIWKSLES